MTTLDEARYELARSPQKYEAFSELGGTALRTADFLRATAARHERGELSAAEYTARLTDMADILTASWKKADGQFFGPPPRQTN